MEKLSIIGCGIELGFLERNQRMCDELLGMFHFPPLEYAQRALLQGSALGIPRLCDPWQAVHQRIWRTSRLGSAAGRGFRRACDQ